MLFNNRPIYTVILNSTIMQLNITPDFVGFLAIYMNACCAGFTCILFFSAIRAIFQIWVTQHTHSLTALTILTPYFYRSDESLPSMKNVKCFTVLTASFDSGHTLSFYNTSSLSPIFYAFFSLLNG